MDESLRRAGCHGSYHLSVVLSSPSILAWIRDGRSEFAFKLDDNNKSARKKLINCGRKQLPPVIPSRRPFYLIWVGERSSNCGFNPPSQEVVPCDDRACLVYFLCASLGPDESRANAKFNRSVIRGSCGRLRNSSPRICVASSPGRNGCNFVYEYF